MMIMAESRQTIKIITSDGVAHVMHARPSELFPALIDPGLVRFEGQLVSSLSEPAVQFEDGLEIWFKDGEFVKLQASPTKSTSVITLQNGNQHWITDQTLHRADGPAFSGADGTLAWYFNGRLHRTDGPAVILPDGTMEWFIEGKRHRTDGPAVEFASGRLAWFIDGKRISPEEWGAWQVANRPRQRKATLTKIDPAVFTPAKLVSAREQLELPFAETPGSLRGANSLVSIYDDRQDFETTQSEVAASPEEPEVASWTLPLLSLLAVGVISATKAIKSKNILAKQQPAVVETSV